MPELNPEALRSYVDGMTARVKAQGEARLAESSRLLGQKVAAVEGLTDFLINVDLPARELIRLFEVKGVWGSVPETIRESERVKIKSWTDRAAEGDVLAQAVLLRSQTILADKKIPTEGLPSFQWEASDKIDK
ncbi:MAG TPA: hypothetical protein VLE91_01220 [Candidatus Saccharimonadales bacterium]|nr:hypothetical protein [Candidatus Saccharimonadales bacterium]